MRGVWILVHAGLAGLDQLVRLDDIARTAEKVRARLSPKGRAAVIRREEFSASWSALGCLCDLALRRVVVEREVEVRGVGAGQGVEDARHIAE